MPGIIPTRMIGVQPYSQIVDETGRVIDVGPWLALTNPANPDATPCYRMIDGEPRAISPSAIVALVVPNTQDAIVSLVGAGFTIKGMEVIDS